MIATLDNVELSREELDCLVKLVRLIVEIDDFVTLEESDEMALIAKEVGSDAFWAAFDKARKSNIGIAELESYAAEVGRRQAQELIYTLLEELADADGLATEEGIVLGRLRHIWSLED